MNWFRRMLWAAQNQDEFWREHHLRRREKRLAYWQAERIKHIQRAYAAGKMAQYYQDQITGSWPRDFEKHLKRELEERRNDIVDEG